MGFHRRSIKSEFSTTSESTRQSTVILKIRKTLKNKNRILLLTYWTLLMLEVFLSHLRQVKARTKINSIKDTIPTINLTPSLNRDRCKVITVGWATNLLQCPSNLKTYTTLWTRWQASIRAPFLLRIRCRWAISTRTTQWWTGAILRWVVNTMITGTRDTNSNDSESIKSDTIILT